MRKTDAEKKELIAEIDKVKNEKGVTLEEACQELGTTYHSYYEYKRYFAKQKGAKNPEPKRRHRTKTPVTTMLTLPVPEEREVPLILIFGRAKDVHAALERMPR